MIRSRLLAFAAAALLAAAIPVAAQDKAQSLADMRGELSSLADELQALRAELVGGGSAAMASAGGASALDRMNALESELVQLTARVEELQNHINRVVTDGTNRIGDLEFRLCELEEGCDPANLPVTASLGGPVTGSNVGTGTGDAVTSGAAPELAIGEQADFDRAKAALDTGDYSGAASQFQNFVATYPGSPLTGDAEYLRGEALQQGGDVSNAARAYLNAFSGAPDGPRAPAALLKLGAALGLLQQTQDACVTLGQVGVRFPTAPEAVEATTAMRALGCS